jgi:hypothetical protein
VCSLERIEDAHDIGRQQRCVKVTVRPGIGGEMDDSIYSLARREESLEITRLQIDECFVWTQRHGRAVIDHEAVGADRPFVLSTQRFRGRSSRNVHGIHIGQAQLCGAVQAYFSKRRTPTTQGAYCRCMAVREPKLCILDSATQRDSCCRVAQLSEYTGCTRHEAEVCVHTL